MIQSVAFHCRKCHFRSLVAPLVLLVTVPHQMTVVTVDMDTERTRARHRDKRDKTQDVFAEESEALDQIAKQVFSYTNTMKFRPLLCPGQVPHYKRA